MTKPMEERRKSHRVEVRVPVRLEEREEEPRGASIPGQSANLSEGGVYCDVEKYLAPLTKVGISLLLPAFGERLTRPREIMAEGVVVRTLPERQGRKVARYRIACCFTGMDENEKELIREYVIWRLLARLGGNG
ncbi:MAG: PilZ domain-containing protein [Candidatus Eisenbacteria bacterium]|nr:PilZ domain-containing protein [Candidatus Eisenbacteria bacterium]